MLNDLIYKNDKKQSDRETARVCQKDPEHGRLTVHGSGTAMICANVIERKGPTKIVLCDYGEPISIA